MGRHDATAARRSGGQGSGRQGRGRACRRRQGRGRQMAGDVRSQWLGHPWRAGGAAAALVAVAAAVAATAATADCSVVWRDLMTDRGRQ